MTEFVEVEKGIYRSMCAQIEAAEAKPTEVQKLRWIEAAARAVIEDDCDAVIHPMCWARLRNALAGQPSAVTIASKEERHYTCNYCGAPVWQNQEKCINCGEILTSQPSAVAETDNYTKCAVCGKRSYCAKCGATLPAATRDGGGS